MRPVRNTFGRSCAVVAVALASLGLVGCSGGDPSYCDELSATQSSLETLVDTDVLAEGTDVLSQRYDAFASQLDALIAAAGDEFSEESAAVQASLDQVGTVVDEATSLNLGSAAAQAEPALDSLSTSTQALVDSIQNSC